MLPAKRFARDARGAVAITFALALLPLLGMVGAAVDYSRLSLARTTKQSVVDAAALAGAKAMWEKADQIASVAEAAAVAAATAVVDGRLPGAQKTITAALSTRSVYVKVTQTETIIFGGFVGKETSTVWAESTAVFNPATYCVTLLEASGTALQLNSGSRMNSNCGIQVNSTSSSAIMINSGSTLRSKATCVRGSVANNGGTITPAAKTGCPIIADPFASLPHPPNATNACDHTNIVVSTGESRTLNPGVYCTKFDVNGGTVTLNPGIYIIRDVPLVINQGGKVTGNDVMLFFAGQYGRLQLNSDSTLQISGRTSGTYQGMAMFQSRDAITLSTPAHQVNGNSGMKSTGTIYMPNGALHFNSDGTTNLNSEWMVIVVRAMLLNSDANLIINTEYGLGPPLPGEMAGLRSPEGVRLIR
jgi:Flp pilus assembly protein TadG